MAMSENKQQIRGQARKRVHCLSPSLLLARTNAARETLIEILVVMEGDSKSVGDAKRSSNNAPKSDSPPEICSGSDMTEPKSANLTYKRRRRDVSTPSTSELAEPGVGNGVGVVFSSNNNLDDSGKTCLENSEMNGGLLLDNIQLHVEDLPPKEEKRSRSKKAQKQKTHASESQAGSKTNKRKDMHSPSTSNVQEVLGAKDVPDLAETVRQNITVHDSVADNLDGPKQKSLDASDSATFNLQLPGEFIDGDWSLMNNVALQKVDDPVQKQCVIQYKRMKTEKSQKACNFNDAYQRHIENNRLPDQCEINNVNNSSLTGEDTVGKDKGHEAPDRNILTLPIEMQDSRLSKNSDCNLLMNSRQKEEEQAGVSLHEMESMTISLQSKKKKEKKRKNIVTISENDLENIKPEVPLTTLQVAMDGNAGEGAEKETRDRKSDKKTRRRKKRSLLAAEALDDSSLPEIKESSYEVPKVTLIDVNCDKNLDGSPTSLKEEQKSEFSVMTLEVNIDDNAGEGTGMDTKNGKSDKKTKKRKKQSLLAAEALGDTGRPHMEETSASHMEEHKSEFPNMSLQGAIVGNAGESVEKVTERGKSDKKTRKTKKHILHAEEACCDVSLLIIEESLDEVLKTTSCHVNSEGTTENGKPDKKTRGRNKQSLLSDESCADRSLPRIEVSQNEVLKDTQNHVNSEEATKKRKSDKKTRRKERQIFLAEEVHGDMSLPNNEESLDEVLKSKDGEYNDLRAEIPRSDGCDKKEPEVPVHASSKESLECAQLSGVKDDASWVPEEEKIMFQTRASGNNTKKEDNASSGHEVKQKHSFDKKSIQSGASRSRTRKDDYVPRVSEQWENTYWSPERSICRTRKILLVLDLNGLLADVFLDIHNAYRGDRRIGGKSVFRRPFCNEFLKFCFERFDVGVWSSRKRKNVDGLVDFLMGSMKRKLLFCWSGCGIFPHPYNFMDSEDNSLGYQHQYEILISVVTSVSSLKTLISSMHLINQD
ncbi:hypothetical protein QJS04_geneDACA006928 [Acorus gramineus]|uniref:FCP1 homology domain-containing protein n=1 Tax=Acorus gramineus TaxID=55184 RepID=A0AAV9AUW1_ACOGR|nr:hypothetical protein QJS04_geneDACA006928 [Acorus gramineus]